MLACPKTTYGSTSRLTSATCSGKCNTGADGSLTQMTSAACNGQCPAGQYCVKGELPVKCGSVDKFCPAGSGSPQTVRTKWYTTPMSPWPVKQRTGEAVCPDGFSCSGGIATPCVAGTACKAGVVTACTAKESYCAAKIAEPVPATLGYYTTPEGFQPDGTTPNNREAQTQCDAGHKCTNGVRTECGNSAYYSGPGKGICTQAPGGYFTTPAAGDADTRTGTQICNLGHYCVNGKEFICPAGRYGDRTGLATSGCSGGCLAGSLCPAGSTSLTGNADCPAGFYCTADLCEAPLPCGGVEVFCGVGSGKPVPADKGYFTTPEDPALETKRVAQVVCPAGNFCNYGRRKQCGSAASYSIPGQHVCATVSDIHYSTGGSAQNRTGEQVCPPGTYCTGGVKYPAPAGAYAERGVNASAATTPCPAGTFGATPGLVNAACTGLCDEGHYCPSGSTGAKQAACGGAAFFCPGGSGFPRPVTIGFYSQPVGFTYVQNRVSEAMCTSGYVVLLYHPQPTCALWVPFLSSLLSRPVLSKSLCLTPTSPTSLTHRSPTLPLTSLQVLLQGRRAVRVWLRQGHPYAVVLPDVIYGRAENDGSGLLRLGQPNLGHRQHHADAGPPV